MHNSIFPGFSWESDVQEQTPEASHSLFSITNEQL